MELRLAEELLLLALDDEKGSIVSAASLAIDYGLAGALLLEMAEKGQITLDGKYLKILNPGKTGDQLTDFALDILTSKKKDKDIEYWTSQLGWHFKPKREYLLESLINKGILKKVEGKVLWVFTTKKYPMQYDRPENEIRGRIRGIVLEGKPADTRSLMLINLMEACSLAKEVFKDKQEQKLAEKKIKQLAKGDASSQLVNEAVQGIQTAIMAAITISIATTTVITAG